MNDQAAAVTDAGLAALAKAPVLVWVRAKGTKVTRAGADKLRAALTNIAAR